MWQCQLPGASDLYRKHKTMNAPDPDPRGVQQVWLAQDGRPERQFQVGLKRENIISSFHLMLYIDKS